MRRCNPCFLIGVFLLLGVLAYVFFSRKAPEPSYGGYPLSYWVEQLDAQQPEVEEKEIKAVLRSIGTNALPWLLKWNNYEVSNHKLAFYTQVGKWADWLGLKWYPKMEPEVRRAGKTTQAFCILGAQAKSVIPELGLRIKQRRAGVMARYALVAIAETVPEAWVAILSNEPDLVVQSLVVREIKHGDTNALATLPALRRIMAESTDPEARGIASNALRQITTPK